MGSLFEIPLLVFLAVDAWLGFPLLAVCLWMPGLELLGLATFAQSLLASWGRLQRLRAVGKLLRLACTAPGATG